mgnify:FL=1
MANTDETIEFLIRYLSRFGDNRPLYQILSTALSEAVRVGVLGTDSVLPSERFLASRLSVSRVTVRRALDDLEASGLLKRQQGMRSSVTPRVEKTLSSILGFSKELRLRGVKPGQKWLLRQVSLPTPIESMALGVPTTEQIVRLVRIRFADDIPIAIERATVPQGFLNSCDLVKDSLYEALKETGFMPSRGVQRIRAGVMTRVEAVALESEVGQPLLIVERRCFLADGRTVEFTETRYHGERYDFVSDLKSDQFI